MTQLCAAQKNKNDCPIFKFSSQLHLLAYPDIQNGSKKGDLSTAPSLKGSCHGLDKTTQIGISIIRV